MPYNVFWVNFVFSVSFRKTLFPEKEAGIVRLGTTGLCFCIILRGHLPSYHGINWIGGRGGVCGGEHISSPGCLGAVILFISVIVEPSECVPIKYH